jgi:hypothetical protein
MDSFKRYAIVSLATAAVVMSIWATVGTMANRQSAPQLSEQEIRNKVQVARILLQDKGELATAFNLVAGCMAVVTKRPDLMDKFMADPGICNVTVQPLVLRIFNGQDSVCELGDEHCAFVEGYIRVVALIGAQPRTPAEVDQLTAIIESDYQKRKERAQQ